MDTPAQEEPDEDELAQGRPPMVDPAQKELEEDKSAQERPAMDKLTQE
jgi:hypothetical protein